jgi:hypothetical protein
MKSKSFDNFFQEQKRKAVNEGFCEYWNAGFMKQD